MISERDIAERFTAIWSEQLPLLTPNFMRVFNESHVKKFTESNSNPVPLNNSSIADVIAEYAFHLARIAIVEELDIKNLIDHQDRALAFARETFIQFNQDYEFPKLLSVGQAEEGNLIALNIIAFINFVSDSHEIEFLPTIKGYGVISTCNADLSIGPNLFEIKTVNRTFRSKDLKQLFIYLALQTATGDLRWNTGGLFNPRLSRCCQFNVNGLIGTLSGGRPSLEVFEGILDSIVREVQMDQKF